MYDKKIIRLLNILLILLLASCSNNSNNYKKQRSRLKKKRGYKETKTIKINDKEEVIDFIFERGDGMIDVDINKLTDGQSYMAGMAQQVDTDGIRTAFEVEGYYKGLYFGKIAYYEGNILRMRIAYDMTPSDGVIEGFIFIKFKNKEPYAYIIIDEDWKEKINKTYIVWGMRYEHQKIFNFTEISEGIYMDIIKDERSRHNKNFTESRGGILVGDISSKEAQNSQINGKTFIRLY